jgi:hypothetical protein
MIIYIFYDSRYESEIKKKRGEGNEESEITSERRKARKHMGGKKIVNQFDFLIFNLKSFTV